ncbi:MAG: hypothetical protein JW697_07055, partial [Kosmotogaceae bacterium]|nr:hypothetical protein [Kosmotogaceae bacterium]
LDEFQNSLQSKGLEVTRIRRSQPEDRRTEGLRLATMHRVKGLEFDKVIIDLSNESVCPPSQTSRPQKGTGSNQDLEFLKRALVYVASTRSKQDLVVLCLS